MEVVLISNQETKEEKVKVKLIHLYWIISVLIALIILILSHTLWGKSDDLINLISIASGLVSIALAVVAIIMAVGENVKASTKEYLTNNTLATISTDVQKMSGLINKLDSIEKDIVKSNKLLKKLNSALALAPIQYAETDYSSVPTSSDVSKNDNISKTPTSLIINRGDIFTVNLSDDSESASYRPVLVIQNKIANKFSPTVTVATITSQISKAKLPSHVELSAEKYGLEKDSVILLENVITIDKKKLLNKLTTLDSVTMEKVDVGIMIHNGVIKF